MWRKYSKYGAVKIQYKDMAFDSKKECRRYIELDTLQQAGEISDLQRQVKFVLIPTQREPDTIGPRGRVIKGRAIEKECAYIADFVYKDKDGKTVVEDAKGVRTEAYKIKKKLLLKVHGLRIHEV